MRALFQLCTKHLGLDPLYVEVKERIADMNSYLDADSLRRQANTVVRLTVVTIFGLIGTVTTGFLGMNLLAERRLRPGWRKLLVFLVVFGLTAALTFYTIVKSKRPVGLPRCPVRRAALDLDEGQGAGGGVAPAQRRLRGVHSMDITELSASSLSRAIHAREVSCREVMQATLARIAAVNPTPQRARQPARR